MIKMFFIVLLGFSISACNDTGTNINVNVDSLSEKIDTTAEKIWDSTKAKAKVLKEKVEEAIEKRKDSGNIKSRKDTL